MKGALNGVRVIDLGHVLAAPTTGMILADLGIQEDGPGLILKDSRANKRASIGLSRTGDPSIVLYDSEGVARNRGRQRIPVGLPARIGHGGRAEDRE